MSLVAKFEDHHALARQAIPAAHEHAEAGAMAQEEIDHGHVPLAIGIVQPGHGLGLGFRAADHVHGRELLQRRDQTVANQGLSSTR